MRDLSELRREVIRLSVALQHPFAAGLTLRERAELEGALDGIMFAASEQARSPIALIFPVLTVERIDRMTAERIAEIATPPAALDEFVTMLCETGEHPRCELHNCACRIGQHVAFHGAA